MDTIGKILSDNLKNLRKEKGWNQSDLAERANLSPQAIQLVETGKRWPRKAQIRSIASALGVPEARLFLDPHSAFLDPPIESALRVINKFIEEKKTPSNRYSCPNKIVTYDTFRMPYIQPILYL